MKNFKPSRENMYLFITWFLSFQGDGPNWIQSVSGAETLIRCFCTKEYKNASEMREWGPKNKNGAQCYIKMAVF
jgi:hypothetical protein